MPMKKRTHTVEQEDGSRVVWSVFDRQTYAADVYNPAGELVAELAYPRLPRLTLEAAADLFTAEALRIAPRYTTEKGDDA